jgi:uncharacterized membrane protein YgcG
MIRYIWSFIVEFVGAIICIISPTPIETLDEKDDKDDESDDESDTDACGGGGGGGDDGGGGGGIYEGSLDI